MSGDAWRSGALRSSTCSADLTRTICSLLTWRGMKLEQKVVEYEDTAHSFSGSGVTSVTHYLWNQSSPYMCGLSSNFIHQLFIRCRGAQKSLSTFAGTTGNIFIHIFFYSRYWNRGIVIFFEYMHFAVTGSICVQTYAFGVILWLHTNPKRQWAHLQSE